MMSASASIMPRPGCRGNQREDVRGGVGFNFAINLFGTISFTYPNDRGERLRPLHHLRVKPHSLNVRAVRGVDPGHPFERRVVGQ
jgi:hypothetical protein